jgi:hypothetical protein
MLTPHKEVLERLAEAIALRVVFGDVPEDVPSIITANLADSVGRIKVLVLEELRKEHGC